MTGEAVETSCVYVHALGLFGRIHRSCTISQRWISKALDFSNHLPETIQVGASARMTHSPNDEFISFVSEWDQGPVVSNSRNAWKLLVVDDDDEVHLISRIVLRDFSLDGDPVTLLHAYSAMEAQEILRQEADIAVILLDVVMETDDAGLRLVEWIRRDLGNRLIRIILRTGQPGAAPERAVITEYEINDYKSKTEITDIKLYTAVTVAIRGYRDLRQTQMHKDGFRQLLDSSTVVFQSRSLGSFFETVLKQIPGLIAAKAAKENGHDLSGLVLQARGAGLHFAAASGPLVRAFSHLQAGSEIKHEELSGFPGIIQLIQKLRKDKRPVFQATVFADCLWDEQGQATYLLVQSNRDFLPLEQELLRIFSANISIAYMNLSLNEFVASSQQEIIFTLGEVVESRSQETGNHVRRVGALASLLARRLGLSSQDQEMIRLAAPMHDIGKIGIPDHILQKPGPLDAAERKAVQRHAEIGYAILKNGKRGVLQVAALIAHTHHERWDGQGYPQGLSGDRIPLSGRIVAVADVFDALTHKRAYKAAWQADEAFDYIAENSGSQFDPKVAKVFLSAREEVLEILERYEED